MNEKQEKITLTKAEMQEFRDRINTFLKLRKMKINSRMILAKLSDNADHLVKTFEIEGIKEIALEDKKFKVIKTERE